MLESKEDEREKKNGVSLISKSTLSNKKIMIELWTCHSCGSLRHRKGEWNMAAEAAYYGMEAKQKKSRSMVINVHVNSINVMCLNLRSAT